MIFLQIDVWWIMKLEWAKQTMFSHKLVNES